MPMLPVLWWRSRIGKAGGEEEEERGGSGGAKAYEDDQGGLPVGLGWAADGRAPLTDDGCHSYRPKNKKRWPAERAGWGGVDDDRAHRWGD
ncbi:hypothetical protein NL676_038517 [Syzygium grande]|nr:hypothetical protein NL676_038517 [Syzygium grande]